MTILEMLGQSGILAILGMGVVFGFLVIMVICVTVMGKIIQAMEGNKGAGEPQAGGPALGANAAAVTAAIAAAVTEYQKENS